ncbi:MAG: hypothetical protein IKI76_00990 [Selenomonadaceae bacterium]|nr:hypothetical protein [Selenomonadaceae bacterium]
MINAEERITTVERRVDNLETKFEMFMQEMRDFKTEMRDRDNQRATEIMEMRQKHDADMKDMNQRFYAKMDAMDTKIDGISKHVQNLTVAAIVGIGAAVAGIGAIAVTVIYSVLTR